MNGDSTPLLSIVEEIRDRHSSTLLVIIEEQFCLRIQPKPWWLPKFLWGRILGRLLVLHMFPTKFSYPDGSVMEWRR